MKYVGSKNRIAKEIIPFIISTKRETYIEPFCGGANLIDKVNHPNKIGYDKNKYVIKLLQSLQEGWLPPLVLSEEEYYKIKTFPDNYEPQLVAFAAICCSFSGKWFGGYARGKSSKGTKRNYAAEAYRNLKEQAPRLKGIAFSCSDYLQIPIPRNSVIYCDPPYKDTVKYEEDINHEEFFDWCRYVAKYDNIIYLSEYQAPEDFELLWSKKVNSSLDLNTSGKQNIEKLYRLRYV